MCIFPSEYILDDVGLVGEKGEMVFNFIEEDGAELVDIHLHKDLYQGFVIMGFYCFCEEEWVQCDLFRVL